MHRIRGVVLRENTRSVIEVQSTTKLCMYLSPDSWLGLMFYFNPPLEEEAASCPPHVHIVTLCPI